MQHPASRRRRLLAGAALGMVCAAVPASAAVQSTPLPQPTYRRRRVRGVGDLLIMGGVLAGIVGWVGWRGKRARKKKEADREMQARLARARERSKNL